MLSRIERRADFIVKLHLLQIYVGEDKMFMKFEEKKGSLIGQFQTRPVASNIKPTTKKNTLRQIYDHILSLATMLL